MTSSLSSKTVFPCFYYFDINNRVYEKGSHSAVYEKHFVRIQILEENDKEYVCQFGKTINKRSLLYKINGTTRIRVYTEQEKEDDIYKKMKSHKLAKIIRGADANILREIETVLCLKKGVSLSELYQ